MNPMLVIDIDELNPYVRKVGKQNKYSWKNKSRKIYDHEFLYCFSGKAHITIEDRCYDIFPGTLILIKPDRSHNFWLEEAEEADIIWVHFDYIFRNDVYSLNQLVTDKNSVLFEGILPKRTFIRLEPIFENGFVFPEILHADKTYFVADFIGATFKKILATFVSHDVFWQLDCKILLLQILKMIMHLCPESVNILPFGSDNQITKKIVEYGKYYIETNYHRRISIGEISNLVGLNEDYFGKLFKKETNENFTSFVCRTRLRKAKELLLYSNLSVTNIAEMTGFNDVYYFCKVMKKYEGLSPTEWKNVGNVSKKRLPLNESS